MKPARIVGLLNAAALGTITTDGIEELLPLSLPQLLTARYRFDHDRRRRDRCRFVPTKRLVAVIHAILHAPLSQPEPAAPNA